LLQKGNLKGPDIRKHMNMLNDKTLLAKLSQSSQSKPTEEPLTQKQQDLTDKYVNLRMGIETEQKQLNKEKAFVKHLRNLSR
jgi:hypothetical protein